MFPRFETMTSRNLKKSSTADLLQDFDFQKLYEVTKVVTRNLNKVIDRNLGYHIFVGHLKWIEMGLGVSVVG